MVMMERFSWSRSFPSSSSSTPPPSLSRKSGDKERRRRSRFFCSPSGSSSLCSSSFHPEKNRKKIDDDDDDDHQSALLKASDVFVTSTTLQRRRGARAKVRAITKEEDSEKNDDDALSDDQPRWSGEPSRADANATEIETTATTAIQPPATTSGYTRKWKKRDLSWARDAIPFYVMLPLDVVSRDGVLENKEVLEVALDALARVGVDGVMVDVWWGIVERKRPRNYDWTPYYELFQICEKLGLKVQAVMSFHACGANVGDVYEIKLPDWVLESGIQDPDLFFTDQYGYRNPECISLWADDARTVAGRTPRECYRDFMVSFRDTFENLLQSTISEIAVDVDRVESCDTRRIQKINVHRTVPSGVSRGLANFSVTINERWARWRGTPPRLDASNGADLVRTIAADTTTYRKKLVSFGPIEGVGTANTVNSFSIGTRKSSLNTATRRYKLREKCSITRKLALT